MKHKNYSDFSFENFMELAENMTFHASKIRDILDQDSKEIHMWRKRFLDSYELTAEERPYVEEYFYATPSADIKDPVDYVEKIRTWVKEDHL